MVTIWLQDENTEAPYWVRVAAVSKIIQAAGYFALADRLHMESEVMYIEAVRGEVEMIPLDVLRFTIHFWVSRGCGGLDPMLADIDKFYGNLNTKCSDLELITAGVIY